MKKTIATTFLIFACGFASHADMVEKEKEQQATITQEVDDGGVYHKLTTKIFCDGEEVYVRSIMKNAEFKGGKSALMNFMKENIQYPEKALMEGTQGIVIVRFVITQQGEVKNPVVIRSVDPLLDEEALRFVGKMPDWIPAEIDGGKKVNSYYTLPITFKLVDSPSKTKPKKR
ncbi:MAG: energy transducer TonB [Paludibacteraceae bacterium]|nr:energy transducer TonB [Paludibacteraceae bacterium]